MFLEVKIEIFKGFIDILFLINMFFLSIPVKYVRCIAAIISLDEFRDNYC